jgi:hypothetical protein
MLININLKFLKHRKKKTKIKLKINQIINLNNSKK